MKARNGFVSNSSSSSFVVSVYEVAPFSVLKRLECERAMNVPLASSSAIGIIRTWNRSIHLVKE